MRTLYLVGLAYSGVCGIVAYRMSRPADSPTPNHAPAPGPGPTSSSDNAESWYQAMKPFCNSVEVETRMRQAPPPSGQEGAGYAGACFALAGKIDQARQLLTQLPAGERGGASAIVFNIGHPVADAGDDRSAGPIMELVLEFWPENYMALYHAGMSEYTLGQPDLARTHLHRFLELYNNPDGWRSNAIEVLGRLEPGSNGKGQ
jgi:tetratricopeptide repeat protein